MTSVHEPGFLSEIERLAAGNPGDVKAVGEGVSELRVDYGPVIEVYYIKHGLNVRHFVSRWRQGYASQRYQDGFAPGEESVGEKPWRNHNDEIRCRRASSHTEEMAAYLEACLEEANGDAAFIAKALGDIARAKGMSQVARDAGLSRESLYKALSGERSPGFDTILKVINALGLKLHAEAVPGK